MSSWAQSFWLAVLLATIPMLWVRRVLQNLPPPILLSHRPWPGWAHMALVCAVTGSVSLFIHTTYEGIGGGAQPATVALHFLITALIYVFGVVLLIRPFSGLYPEYFVTTGRSGLSIRKGLYRNIEDVETRRASGTETQLQVRMRSGERLLLELPTRDLALFYEAVKESQPEL